MLKTQDDFNFLELTDSYKVTQWLQYPDDVKYLSSYYESRGGKFSLTGSSLLQYYLKKYFSGRQITQEKLASAKLLLGEHFGNEYVNEKGWQYIIDKYDGHLPLEIRAVPEGTLVPTRNILMRVENTDPNCAWLTNYAETILCHMWSPFTVQANSHFSKLQLLEYLEKSGTPDDILFKLHDFGFRGVSSIETAAMTGLSHLLHFLGTDNIIALRWACNYYNAESAIGFSIAASEHSTMTIKGKNGEAAQMGRMLDKFPTGLVACVSDSYDIFGVCRYIWGEKYHDRILGRDGVLVIRPDSGPPAETLIRVIQILMDKFGYELNDKGYKVLNPHVRTIQGDGISYESMGEIMDHALKNQISVDNFAFGSGGALLQQFNRDTQNFAFKACAQFSNDEWHDVWKDPITSTAKSSKKGRQKLIKKNGTFKTVRFDSPGKDLLETVFRNGKLVKEYTIDDLRKNSQFI